VKAKEGPKG